MTPPKLFDGFANSIDPNRAPPRPFFADFVRARTAARTWMVSAPGADNGPVRRRLLDLDAGQLVERDNAGQPARVQY
jgi:hypothetical protein